MTQRLDHRSCGKDGTIHKKRSDTVSASLRRIYGKLFATGHRSDMMLGKLLDAKKEPTLSQYRKHHS